jgi:hypothetical protein
MSSTESPVSFPVNVLRLPASGMPVRFEADEDQKAALAAAHDLVSVGSFRADLLVSNWNRDGVKITGTVKANIVQACVVTLEPVDAVVDADIYALFVPEGSRLAKPDISDGGEMLLDAEGEDGPEPFSGDTVDAGALAEEFFALGINPYPRKAGAQPVVQTADDDEEDRGPLYEKLKALKGKG